MRYTEKMAPRGPTLKWARSLRPFVGFVGFVVGCEVAPPDDDVTLSAVTESGLAPCAPAESAYFAAALVIEAIDEPAGVACEIASRRGSAEEFALELECGGAAGELLVAVSPPPSGDALAVGAAIRVTQILAPIGLGAADAWLRVEDLKGRLLLAYVAGGRLDPPDGAPWALPFAVREAPSSCMVEETACGASQRGAVDLQLAGGAPVRLFEGTGAVVGDKGAYVARVAAARVAPAGSACAPGWQLGLLAQR